VARVPSFAFENGFLDDGLISLDVFIHAVSI
jgi:hypothetical protein